ncbi:MAG: sulfite exporter TauE/SafE family protein [Flavobacteriales bacterium]|nr:sulfite exporter TauE/SafE family protein [Flavobacteriales bacterium]
MNLYDISWPGLFLFLLPVVAFLYAGVGHGGASGYLTLMALWSFPVIVMKPTALVLNLFVAAVSFILYARKGHFNLRLFLSFAVASVPMSFLGGMIEVDAGLYKKILALFLVFAILRMLSVFGKDSRDIRAVPIAQGLAVGAAIGFFSGLIGIGGGIILSPLILLMRWGAMKEAAAVSAAFIWVNSASGLAGHLSRGVNIDPQAWLLVAIALVGGALGAFMGSSRFSNVLLTRMLAAVLAIAAFKLLIT